MERVFKPGRYYPAPLSHSRRYWFNRELELIGEMNPYGKPNLVLTWGQDKMWFRNGKQQPQYALCRGGSFDDTTTRTKTETGLDLVTTERVWFGPNLYCVERWYPPEAICPMGPEYWQSMRYVWDEGWIKLDGRLVRHGEPKDVMGPYPAEGQYRCLFWIAGENYEYAEPNGELLTALREAWQRRETGEDEKPEVISATFDELERRRNMIFDLLGEKIDDTLETTAHWIAAPARKRKGGSGTRRIILPGTNPLQEVA